MSILFVTPCYGGMVTAQHFRSCINLKEELTKLGLEHDWLIGWNESLVHRARMEMVANYLQNTKFSHLMFLDADIEFLPDDVAKVWNLNADVGCGAYRMKKAGAGYAAWKDGKLVTDLGAYEAPVEVDYAGTGFMMVRRETFQAVYDYLIAEHSRVEKLIFELAGDRILSVDENKTIRAIVDRFSPSYSNGDRIPALFQTPIHNDVLESEDYFFSRMARAAGFKIMMDPAVILKHWGQHGYC